MDLAEIERRATRYAEDLRLNPASLHAERTKLLMEVCQMLAALARQTPCEIEPDVGRPFCWRCGRNLEVAINGELNGTEKP